MPRSTALWPLLNDVSARSRVHPNAEVTEIVDAVTYRAKVAVKVGPVFGRLSCDVTVESRDDLTHTRRWASRATSCAAAAGVRATIVFARGSLDGATRVSLPRRCTDQRDHRLSGGRLIAGVANAPSPNFGRESRSTRVAPARSRA